MIYNSRKRVPQGSGRDNWRCSNQYFVTSVWRHLQAEMGFATTSRPTAESRTTVVNSATSHLVRTLNWWGMSSFTPGKNRTSAKCVRRHLQVGKPFPTTIRSTVGSRSTGAQSVTNHLFTIVIWRCTPSFTPVRSHTSAQSATFHAVIPPPSKDISRSTLGINRTTAVNATIQASSLQLSKDTSRSTPGRNSTIAIDVIIKQQYQTTCKHTRRRTLVRSYRDAQCASIRAFNMFIWKITWWESTQKKNLSNVTSATIRVLLLMICTSTWGRTPVRDSSSATNATRLTQTRDLSKSTSKCTRLESRLHQLPLHHKNLTYIPTWTHFDTWLIHFWPISIFSLFDHSTTVHCEQPFKFNQCDKTFTHKQFLTNYSRIHQTSDSMYDIFFITQLQLKCQRWDMLLK